MKSNKYNTNQFIPKLILFTWTIVFLSIGTSLYSQNKIDLFQEQLKETKAPETRARLLLDISDQFFYSNSDSSLHYSIQALKLIEDHSIKNDSLLAETQFCIGSVYCWLEDTVRGFYHIDKSIKIAEKTPYKNLLVSCYHDKGMAYSRMGAFDKSMELFQINRKMAYKDNDTMDIYSCNNNIGIIYLDLKAFDKAEPYFRENYSFAKQMGAQHEIAISLSNLGDAAYGKKDYKKAIQYQKRANAIADSLDLKFGVMHTYHKLAKAYDKTGMIELSLLYAQNSYILAKELAQKPEIRLAAITIANSLNNQKKYTEAIVKVEEALALLDTLGSKETNSKIYKVAANSYQGIGDLDNAILYLEKYEKERDFIFDQERTKVFAEIDIQYQTQKKEKENVFLKSEQLKNETIIRQRTLIAILISLGLLLLSILTLFLFSRMQHKKENFMLLEQRVEERTAHLNTTNKKLEKANEELESFAYIASHDLKEPLRNISRFSGLIKQRIKTGKIESLEEYLEYIIVNVKQMNALIEDILSFSKIDKFNATKMVPLQDVIQNVKQELESVLNEKNAVINYNHNKINEFQKSILVPNQLSLVFKNLIENGIKYNESSLPVININYHQNNQMAVFSIKDNGIGIAEPFHDQIFEMFKRLHNRSEYNGSGIGLAICKKTIENLDGEILLRSEEGKGSIFEFSLPLEKVEFKIPTSYTLN